MIARTSTAPTPLRIAMVAACPFPSLRGSQVLVRELAQALADRGHKVHLVTYPHGESVVAIRGIHVHRARPPRFGASASGLGWRKLMLDVSLALTLHRVVRSEGIQVIHAHNYEAPLLSYFVRWLTGVPVVYHSHNALSDELAYYVAPGWRRRLVRYLGGVLDRQVPRRADFSIALTPELEGFLLAHGVAAQNLATIPPTMVPAPLPDAAGGNGDIFAGHFVVMYAGNLDPYQDLQVLSAGFADLCATVPHALLVLVTHETGWQRRIGGRLMQLIETGRARVIVASTFSAVRRLMARADVLVCPRSSWSGFPIKVLNYMASGRAVVAAEGSAKGVIDGDTGLVFHNGDVQALADALRRLARNPALRARLGKRARAAVGSGGALQRSVGQIEAIYAQVCGLAEGRGASACGAEEARLQGLIAFSRDRISAASGRARN